MQLPFLTSHDMRKDFFLSLQIKPYKIGVILFEKVGGKLIILSTHEIEVAGGTSEISADELLAAVDAAVSFVEGSLPEKASVDKTIFSLPYNWVIDSRIKPDYLDRLKIICKALELTPVGYLTSIEAIVHFMEQSEGAPVSAVFIEAAKDKIFAYLIRAGKIIEARSDVIESNLIETCERILAKIESVDVLPAKIVLLDIETTQDTQQEFLSHKWPAVIPFLHVPQVVTLAHGFENEATINGVATQMELEVLLGVKSSEIIDEEKILEETTGEEFGFAREGEQNTTQKKESEKEKVSEADSAQAGEPKDEPNIKYFQGTDSNNEDSHEGTPGSKLPAAINLEAALTAIKNLKMPKFSEVPFFSAGGPLKSRLIMGLVALVILVVGFSFFYYNFILGAKITVFTDKKAISNSVPITFSSSENLGKSIRLEVIEEESKGEETKNTTGKKETGDRAHGSITIYNKGEDKKTFAKGTVIIGPNNIEFELIDDVNVASTSSFSTLLSSVTGKVQAGKFGKEYNLPSNTNFTIKGFSSSDFIGKNSDALVGGTSKTTIVVSKKDLDDLLAAVVKNLESDSISRVTGDAGSNYSIFPKALSFEVTSKSFTKKEGDESSNVGVSATIKYTIGKYKKEDLKKFAESLSKNKVPSTYVLKEKDSKNEIVDIKIEKGKSASATLKINAIYLPQIDIKKLATEVKGKTLTSAEKQIRSIAGVTDVILSLKNKIPFFPQILPGNSKNVDIEVNN